MEETLSPLFICLCILASLVSLSQLWATSQEGKIYGAISEAVNLSGEYFYLYSQFTFQYLYFHFSR